MVGAEAEATIAGGEGQHQQRGQGQQQEGTDREFETGTANTHGNTSAGYLKRKADNTKLNISTSSEALTTARVVATDVPSMVGSAW